jgi:hypothetical protein
MSVPPLPPPVLAVVEPPPLPPVGSPHVVLDGDVELSPPLEPAVEWSELSM